MATFGHDPETRSPATHAFIIGVGRYMHLPGGGGTTAANSFNLRQLESPPASARRIADWFMNEFHNPYQPLASLELLVSEPGGVTQYQGKSVEEATLANIKAAHEKWCERGDRNKDNLLLFYFCGHGLGRGTETTLLASDFGASALTPMKNTIHLDGMVWGMDRIAARNQIYFIDACRNVPHTLLRQTSMGEALIEPIENTAFAVDRNFPIFYATSNDARAYGLRGDLSRFTSALLHCLDGLGSDDTPMRDDLPDPTPWIVNTYALSQGLRSILKRENQKSDVPFQMFKVGGEDSGIALHYLNGKPYVPVQINVLPAEECEHASLRVFDRLIMNHRPHCARGAVRTPWPWEIKVPSGRYEVCADAIERSWIQKRCQFEARPPFRLVSVTVQP
jgi:hypothetical protein